MRARVCGEFSGAAAGEFARTPEMGWDAVGVPRGGSGTTASVLHMPAQALLVYRPTATLAKCAPRTIGGAAATGASGSAG